MWAEQQLQVNEPPGRDYAPLSQLQDEAFAPATQDDDRKIMMTSVQFGNVSELESEKGRRDRIVGGPGPEVSAGVRAREARSKEMKRFKLGQGAVDESSASASDDIDRMADLKKDDEEAKSERCSAVTEGESDLSSKQQQKQVIKTYSLNTSRNTIERKAHESTLPMHVYA